MKHNLYEWEQLYQHNEDDFRFDLYQSVKQDGYSYIEVKTQEKLRQFEKLLFDYCKLFTNQNLNKCRLHFIDRLPLNDTFFYEIFFL